MQPKVSIVVPIYNVKKECLNICVESIINQSYKNIEIILVDDGSEEECKIGCDLIAKSDSRIKVIHKANQGVSEARNTGTIEANGEYIMYVDADDIIAQYTIEHGINVIQKYNADMALGAVKKIREIDQFQENLAVNKICSVDMLETNRFDELRRVYLNNATEQYSNIEGKGYIIRGPVSRIIKQEIAKRNPFPQGLPLGEDVIWNMRLLNDCRIICIVNEIWYGYMIYESSAVRKYYGNREQVVSQYLNTLINENKDFCNENIRTVAKNIAIEFYCLLRYEYMSKKSGLRFFQKIKSAKDTISKKPWRILKDKNAISEIPRSYRIIIKTVGYGGWIFIIKVGEIVSKMRCGNS